MIKKIIYCISIILLVCNVRAQELNMNYLSGVVAFQNLNFDKSISDFQKALNNEKKLAPEIHLYLGQCFMAQQQFEKAFDHFYQANHLVQDIASYQMARLHALIQAPDDAFAFLEQNLKSRYKESYITITYDSAFKNLKSSRYWDDFWAKDRFSKTEQKYNDIAYEFKINNLELALELADEYLSKHPKSHRFLYLRAKIFIQNNDYRNALNDLNLAIRNRKNVEEYHMARGRCFFILKKYEKANKDFNEVLKLNPYNLDAYFERGKALALFAKFDEAIEDMSFFLDFYPYDTEKIYEYAQYAFISKHYLEVLKSCNKLIEQNKGNFNYYNLRGKAFYEINKYQNAKSDFAMALDLKPKSAEANYYLAMSYHYLGKTKQACSSMKRAVELGVEDGHTFIYRHCKE